MLYELAAKQGMKEAQFNIAQILHYGPSEMQNLQKAYRWYLKAANQNVLEFFFYLENFAPYKSQLRQSTCKAFNFGKLGEDRS